MARKDRHTLLVGRWGRMARLCGWLSRAAVGTSRRHGSSIVRSDVRPVFFLNPFGVGIGNRTERRDFAGSRPATDSFVKGLILAQNERWRRGLGMQVERAGVGSGQWRKGE